MKKIKASIDLCDKLTEEQELNEINTKEYFEYTEEEEIKGNRYTHVEEWIDKFSVIAQIAWSENPLIMSFLMHPNYKRIFMVFYIVVIPVALLIIGIIEKSWSVLIPGLLIYVPVIIAYVIRKKGL